MLSSTVKILTSLCVDHYHIKAIEFAAIKKAGLGRFISTWTNKNSTKNTLLEAAINKLFSANTNTLAKIYRSVTSIARFRDNNLFPGVNINPVIQPIEASVKQLQEKQNQLLTSYEELENNTKEMITKKDNILTQMSASIKTLPEKTFSILNSQHNTNQLTEIEQQENKIASGTEKLLRAALSLEEAIITVENNYNDSIKKLPPNVQQSVSTTPTLT